MKQKFKAHKIIRTSGFSLIEVLVAMLLLVIGVLGAASMQLNALKFSQTSSTRTQAAFLAYSIVDMMRANRTAALADNYNIALGAVPAGGANPIANTDLLTWTQAVSAQLIDGKGSVVHVNAGANIEMVTVTLEWDESRVGGSSNVQAGVPTPDRQQFVFVTQL